MKKIILAVAVMGLAAAGASTANAGVRFSIGIPAPVLTVRAPVVAVPSPVYVAPPVVCAPPAPVVGYPAPAYCAPVPRIYRAPAPVVRFGFDFGHFHPEFRQGRW